MELDFGLAACAHSDLPMDHRLEDQALAQDSPANCAPQL
jgi:hypothetical protein